jgi:3-hydroxybutyryl-CoA dehydrogenase
MRQETTSPAETTVAVVGLGLLGRGIAACFLGYGFRVIGFGRSSQSHERARDYISRGLAEMVEHAGFDKALLDTWQDRYQQTERFDDWGQCDFVVESIAEDLAAKQDVYDQIERNVGPAVPIASNTSAIPITELQQGRRHPERFLGMHWFEPAHATRFLEIVPGDRTSPATMQSAIQLAQRCGKEPSVLNKDLPGFIVNRMGYALYREALHLLEFGVADAETIDRSFRNALGVWSTVFGPFGWMDLTGGPKLYADCMDRVLPTLSNATGLPKPIQELSDANALGVTNGRGFYQYTAEDARRADERFHEHAWKARALMNHYFPLKDA